MILSFSRDRSTLCRALSGVGSRLIFLSVVGWMFLVTDLIEAQDSAPSSHLVFDDHFSGDLLIHQIRIPKAGIAKYTYYEALGWRGKAAGYAGLQAHPQGPNFIFSIWDHRSHRKPIRVVHRAAGTEVKGFGGEGTGLKSWNFQLGWDADTWYTLVARCWDHSGQTRFGFWVHSPERRKWNHLVTMEVAVESARFQGGTDAFIEDWLDTGRDFREIQLKNGWKRKTDGDWFPFQSARYSVNAWDLKPSKRSYHYRLNWNAGTRQDDQEAFYFMQSGGATTRPMIENPATLRVERREQRPDFPKAIIRSLKARQLNANTIQLDWQIDDTCLPQFRWEIEVTPFDPDERPMRYQQTSPTARTAQIPIPDSWKSSTVFLELTLVDLLDHRTKSAKALVELNARR